LRAQSANSLRFVLAPHEQPRQHPKKSSIAASVTATPCPIGIAIESGVQRFRAASALWIQIFGFRVWPRAAGSTARSWISWRGQSADLWLAPTGAKKEEKAPTSVSLSDQGLVQVLQAAVTGLEPGKPYLIALSSEPSGNVVLEPLQGFMTNPAGAAIVNAVGPIRQLVRGEDKTPRRYLVILPGTPENHGAAVQVQTE